MVNIESGCFNIFPVPNVFYDFVGNSRIGRMSSPATLVGVFGVLRSVAASSVNSILQVLQSEGIYNGPGGMGPIGLAGHTSRL